MAKKPFDPSTPHIHRCPECQGTTYCRGQACEYPEWNECFNCAKGWYMAVVEGTVVYEKKVPRRVRVDQMFP